MRCLISRPGLNQPPRRWRVGEGKTEPYSCHGIQPPKPSCAVGVLNSWKSGCPTDAAVRWGSKAWPVCLGKGFYDEPYVHGDFHCLLTCPVGATDLHSASCRTRGRVSVCARTVIMFWLSILRSRACNSIARINIKTTSTDGLSLYSYKHD